MPRRKRTVRHDFFDDDLDADDTNSQSSKNGYPPEQRNAANLRERARMRVLSGAFGRLKTKLPNIPPDTKLSKLDTLRLAIIYIKQLKGALDGGNIAFGCNFDTNSYLSTITQSDANLVTNPYNTSSIPATMSWPFGFHQQPFMQQEAAATSTSSSSSSSNSHNISNHNNNNNNNIYINNNNNNVELFAKYAFTEHVHQTCAHNQNFYQLETHHNAQNNEQQQYQEQQQQQQQDRIYYRHKPN